MLPQRNELRLLLEHSQTPCASLFVTLHSLAPHENLVRVNNLVRQAEEKLSNITTTSEAWDILRPTIEVLRATIQPTENVRGFAAFACPGFHREFLLPMDLTELAAIGRRFFIRPLLPLFTENDRFYILTISQKHIRLFEANRFEAHEIHVEGLPADLDKPLNSEGYEKELQFHAAASGGGGKRAIIFHGGKDEPKDRLANYLHKVSGTLFGSRSMQEAAPLVVAAVEYVAALYRKGNTYPNLVEDCVTGNPDLLSTQELHAKAWETVKPKLAMQRERAIANYNELAGASLTSHSLKEIYEAAPKGRVRTLIIASGVHRFNEDGEDQLNFAASETLLNGGIVYEVPPANMPDKADIAALYRY